MKTPLDGIQQHIFVNMATIKCFITFTDFLSFDFRVKPLSVFINLAIDKIVRININSKQMIWLNITAKDVSKRNSD